MQASLKHIAYRMWQEIVFHVCLVKQRMTRHQKTKNMRGENKKNPATEYYHYDEDVANKQIVFFFSNISELRQFHIEGFVTAQVQVATRQSGRKPQNLTYINYFFLSGQYLLFEGDLLTRYITLKVNASNSGQIQNISYLSLHSPWCSGIFCENITS